MGLGRLGDGIGGLNEIVHLGQWDSGGAVDIGQMLVDLENLQVGNVEDLRFRLLGAGHIHIAVFIGRRHRGNENVGGSATLLDGGNGRVDVMGYIVNPARVVLFPQGGTVEHRIDLNGTAQLVLHNEGILFIRVGAPDVHVVHMIRHLMEPPKDVPGLVAVETVVYNIPIMDHAQGIVHSDEFGPVQGFQLFFHILVLSL